MPKVIELTFELNLHKVSCPGVWLCQDGLVSLSIYALGSSYQTSMVPPIFPLVFKEPFYFRRRFQQSCSLSSLFCVLKDETIYCELVQWSTTCRSSNKCIVLAQYLGALNDVLFPPQLCSTDGVDLLMRRTKNFPGILAPKIEISTKVRIDEVTDMEGSVPRAPKVMPCSCRKEDMADPTRQKQVCHTPMFHRHRCAKTSQKQSRSRSDTRSCCNLFPKEPEPVPSYSCLNHSKQYGKDVDDDRPMLESRFVEEPYQSKEESFPRKCIDMSKIKPCTCEICRKYHELFHSRPVLNS